MLDLLQAWQKLTAEYSQSSKGLGKTETLLDFVSAKIPESTLIFFSQIEEKHQEEITKWQETEKKLLEDINTEKANVANMTKQKHELDILYTTGTHLDFGYCIGLTVAQKREKRRSWRIK